QGDVVAPTDNIGGMGFREGALKLVLLATDWGFAFVDDAVDPYVGAGGVTVPASQLQGSSFFYRDVGPANGAGIQETVDALNAIGAQVIGLGHNITDPRDPQFDNRMQLEALATLTGAINTTSD